MSTAAEAQPETGHVPAGPQRLGAREWLDALKRTFKEFLADDCTGLAQEVAYSSLLAFFPAAAFVVGILGVLDLYDNIESLIDPIAPQGVTNFINTLQQDASTGRSALAIVLGFVGALWAASGAMGTVIKAVNRAYDRLETRPFWKVRAIAIVLVLLTAVTTTGVFLLIVFGGDLGNAIATKAGLGTAFNVVWGVLRWPVALVAILLFFAFVYYLAPNRDQRNWKWISPGSLVGSVMWLALSGLFALYVTFAGHYTKTYGAIASGIILLLWLNYSAYALLFGAELNAELDRQADIHAAGGPRAGLVKVARRNR